MADESWAWVPAPKAVWGRRAWNWLHVTAINYPEQPTAHDRALAAARLREFVARLPCGECVGHAEAYLARAPPDLSDTYAYQAWTVDFHNDVNIRLGKPVYPFEAYLRAYADEISWACGGVCVGRP
jgi:hypothetical protein